MKKNKIHLSARVWIYHSNIMHRKAVMRVYLLHDSIYTNFKNRENKKCVKDENNNYI